MSPLQLGKGDIEMSSFLIMHKNNVGIERPMGIFFSVNYSVDGDDELKNVYTLLYTHIHPYLYRYMYKV